ncbi:MAG: NTP transferase domain-containing protein [Rhodospirillaceae bacterium]|nr:NTP transferase domain-containing protein [Rhodospirillaceae bacterium]
MIIAVIPAKGGSRRLPNKNMVKVGGLPMLDYSIRAVRACERIDAVYVSTDSDEIALHAESHGVPVIRRPESLGGETPIADVYRHAVGSVGSVGEAVEVVVGLQPDHPDRDVSVSDALDRFLAEGVDRLMSTEADGTKNGAHYILSRHFLETGESRKDVVIVDDCTNIHHASDLARAEARLADRSEAAFDESNG